MPRGGRCNHPRCLDYDEGCRMLTDEELTPNAEEIEVGRKYFEGGWKQISAKYHRVIRWKEPPPDLQSLVNPEFRNTFWGKKALEALERLGEKLEYELTNEYNRMHRPDHSGMVEVAELSLREFKAFQAFRNEANEKRRAAAK